MAYKITLEDRLFMAEHGWDLQPDDETFRNRSASKVEWVAKHFDDGYYAFAADPINPHVETILSPTFDSPVAVVVFLELERSNNT